MARAPNLFLIGYLLQGALCQVFKVIVPQSIEVLSASCVTIPCSFDIESRVENDLDNTCKAIWRNQERDVVFDSSEQTTINGKLRGILTEKDCTTTLNNIGPGKSGIHFFRLECDKLGYNFEDHGVDIVVKADPPNPTLTPSTLEMKERTSVSLTCSAPAPCLSHPPTLIWTPRLGDSLDTLQENDDKTKVKTSVLTFTASHLHHGKEIYCTAAYSKSDGSTQSTNSGNLTLNISFAPQILPSFGCTKAASQVNCSCETVGNPFPILEWDLDGLPVNHSEKFVVSYETLIQNVTSLRSIISMKQPQERDLHILVCRSFSSLGSDSQQFYFYRLEPKTSAEYQGGVTLPILIATVAVLTAALVSALLFAIWAQRTYCTGDASIAVINQGLTSEEGNEVSDKPEEDIYDNTDVLEKANELNTHQEHVQVTSKSSKKENEEEGDDLTYSSVIWKSKRKGERCGNRNLSGSSFLEEERCIEGGTCRNSVTSTQEMASLYGNMGPRNDTNEAVDTVYAQVKFRDENTMQ